MCMGGDTGDGGAGQMRADETKRQQDIEAATRSVNEIFDGRPASKRGVNPVTTPVSGQSYYDASGNPVSYNFTPPMPGDPNWGVARGDVATQPQGDYYSATEDVPATSGFNDDYFKSIADSYQAYQAPLFEEQVTKARRALPMRFSSTDNSDYQRALGELETDISRQSTDLSQKGLDFANERRAEVERNRSDLISMANSGTNATALATMAANRSAALSKPPTFSPIADLFSKYTAMGANYAVANAANSGGNTQATNPMANSITSMLFGPSKSASKVVN